MAYVAHPYASASPCSSTISPRPMRPTIITTCSAPGSSPNATSPKPSPSPIVFARASVISPLHDTSKDMTREKEKKDRRRGLMAAERVAHAGLDALLRAPEATPRPAPRLCAPQLVRSPTNLSVAPIIERPHYVTLRSSSESNKSGSSTSTPRAASPAPSSGSGSAPSTPGQPRTPVSIEFDSRYSYPSVAPLMICKTNRTPSPSPPVKFHSSRTPSPIAKSKENDPNVRSNKRRSPRFSARMTAAARAECVFAPLEIDTTAARSLDLSFESPRDKPTLTGVVAELESKAVAIPPVPSLPTDKGTPRKEEKEEDENEWLDVEGEDPLADAEFYRADIASHLQLFSSNYSFPTIARRPSYARHRRNGSSSSSVSHWQLPPARPDSLPPPPHFLSSLSESAADSAPALPSLPTSENTQHASLRRASASSLASTASGRSTRSTGSASGKSKRRSSKNARYPIARRSAVIGVGRRRSSNTLSLNRTRGQQQTRPGPSTLLDPTFMELAPAEGAVERARPPPRFSIPASINDDDMLGDDVAVINIGTSGEMGKLDEEDEGEDGLIDPFVLDKFPVFDASGPVHRDEAVDPFTIPTRTADVPISPSSFSPISPSPYSQPQPFLLVPNSPTTLSFPKSGSSTGSFDVESLYSSYAAFSPGLYSNSNSNPSTSDVNSIRKTSASSIYCDASGRPLQSRWSVSTFASSAPPPPSASSSRSFLPKLTGVSSRLSARLKAARERAIQQAREREEREREKPAVVKPYPFFPTPQPVSPKRRVPGPYVPKPELMPASQRNKTTGTNTSSSRTSSSSSSSSRTSCKTVSTPVPSPPPKDKNMSVSNACNNKGGKDTELPSYIAQFAQYRAHRHSPIHAAHSSSSPPRSLKSRNGSTDSLSAFPFTLGGEQLGSPRSGSRISAESGRERTISGGSGEGLRRKPIPIEIFARA